MNIIANELYEDRLKQFWEIKRYTCDQSYCFHDMFKKGLYASVKVITSIDVDSVLYPYQHWMEQPFKFESLSNNLATLTFAKTWTKKNSTVQYMKEIQQHFSPHDKSIQMIDVKSRQTLVLKIWCCT